MAAGGISSLGAGSGLDLSGLLDQLRDAERASLRPIQAQQDRQETRISALGQLKSSLTSFQDSVSKLQDPSLYESLSASGGADVVSASADKTAQAGSYNVQVNDLATSGTLATERVNAPDEDVVGTTGGNFELDFDGGTSVSVTIDAGSSLEDIRDAVNAKESAGVSASIINDGEGYRLSLISTKSGKDASIAATTSDNFNGLVDATLRSGTAADNPGQDAQINVNGVDISSTTNTVEGAIQGVTLDLESSSPESTTVEIQQDTLKVREAVSGFVSSFNDLKGTIGDLTAFDPESGEAGALNGDRTARTVESRLRSDLSGAMGEGELDTLSEIGIRLQRDGTLELDEGLLDDQVSGNMQALGEFFAGPEGNGGIAGRIGSTVEQLVGDAGLVSRSVEGAENRLDRLGDRVAREESRVEQAVERYRADFQQLDSTIAELNQTNSYLTQQLDNLSSLGNN